MIEEWKKKDPVKRIKEHLFGIGALTEKEFETIRKEYEREVDEAFQFARQGPYAQPAKVFRDVYAQGGIGE